MPQPNIVDRTTWLEARKAHLVDEKAFTKLRDELGQKRRELPWVELPDTYTFATNDGPKSLADLFAGRRQLLIYHFMLGPDWEEGCPSCSFWADNFDGIDIHLAARDTTLLAVSRSSLANINAYRTRMDWNFEWVSSLDSSFNVDFDVSFPEGPGDATTYNYEPFDMEAEELAGMSAFIRGDDGTIYHSYSTYARGLDPLNGAYQMLDLTALGRHEDDLPWSMAWLRRHDQYDV